jgi:hypothetical protein
MKSKGWLAAVGVAAVAGVVATSQPAISEAPSEQEASPIAGVKRTSAVGPRSNFNKHKLTRHWPVTLATLRTFFRMKPHGLH